MTLPVTACRSLYGGFVRWEKGSKADGTPFWNQFFVAALRDANGNIVNFVGVQCEVNQVPLEIMRESAKQMAVWDIDNV